MKDVSKEIRKIESTIEAALNEFYTATGIPIESITITKEEMVIKDNTIRPRWHIKTAFASYL
jgi:hypothetical protein